jgi:hypothetical protein
LSLENIQLAGNQDIKVLGRVPFQDNGFTSPEGCPESVEITVVDDVFQHIRTPPCASLICQYADNTTSP